MTRHPTIHAARLFAERVRDAQRMAAAMGLPPEKLRVITEDVGGGFGMKTPPYPSTWRCWWRRNKRGGRCIDVDARGVLPQRQQARDMRGEGELALDANGKFLALRIRCLVNLGAFVGSVSAHIVTNNLLAACPACIASR